MKTRKVCILGGSGFVGRHITELLAKSGLEVRVLTRMRERAKHLILLPTVEVVEADIHDENQLAAQFADCDAVINLVGILHNGKGTQRFAAAHIELASKVISACRKADVGRLLHMSTLNADPSGPSEYLRSKGEAESALYAAMDKLAITIFRPSTIFGSEDSFLNRFATLIKLFPILPLGSADTRFQPVFVEDVARIFTDSLDNLDTYGKAYDICGPRVYTLRELIGLTATIMQKKRLIFALPPQLAKLQATVLEFMPGKPITRDNLRSMQIDSVCECDFEKQFGFMPTALAAIAPTYLAGKTPHGRYNDFRYRAGR